MPGAGQFSLSKKFSASKPQRRKRRVKKIEMFWQVIKNRFVLVNLVEWVCFGEF